MSRKKPASTAPPPPAPSCPHLGNLAGPRLPFDRPFAFRPVIRRIVEFGSKFGSKKKPAAVAAVHWSESAEGQKMGWLGEDTRVSDGEWQIETASRGTGVAEGSRAEPAS
jgi:hypothetical protein